MSEYRSWALVITGRSVDTKHLISLDPTMGGVDGAIAVTVVPLNKMTVIDDRRNPGATSQPR